VTTHLEPGKIFGCVRDSLGSGKAGVRDGGGDVSPKSVRRFLRRVAGTDVQVEGFVREASESHGLDERRVLAALAAFCGGRGAICGVEPKCRVCRVSGACGFAVRKPTMKSLPEDDRPRERLLRFGEQTLSDSQLLAILIRTGIRGKTALEMAQQLMGHAGGFRKLGMMSLSELRRFGLGPARAAQVKAACEIARRFRDEKLESGKQLLCAEDVEGWYRPRLCERKKETFVALFLDTKHRLVAERVISEGSLTASIVHPRELFKEAIAVSANSVIVVHNHPSGDPAPSAEDIEITRRLAETGTLVGIQLLDHVIVAEGGYTSFAEKGLL
jgi:DNA repair protein RadC